MDKVEVAAEKEKGDGETEFRENFEATDFGVAGGAAAAEDEPGDDGEVVVPFEGFSAVEAEGAVFKVFGSLFAEAETTGLATEK